MLDIFLTAVALLLVFEGILPFLSPQSWRNLMARMANQTNKSLRLAGLSSMIAGAMLMFLIHSGIF